MTFEGVAYRMHAYRVEFCDAFGRLVEEEQLEAFVFTPASFRDFVQHWYRVLRYWDC